VIEGAIDRTTDFVMHQLSRRGFLKGVAMLGMALASGFSAIGSVAKAIAAGCPGECFGPCDPCASQCTSGGLTCWCVCSGCNCTPRRVYAYGSWYGDPCVFDCACVACG
jgi:hypothetical protein